MRRAKQQPDPHAGRYWLDHAYALGALAALGDDTAFDRLRSFRGAIPDATYAALLDQYQAGSTHERGRGAFFAEAA